jgi:hypothetical protein
VPAVGASQHHSLNLSSSSGEPIDLEMKNPFLKEQSGNAYENKGAAQYGQGQGGNVEENKGSYA